MSRPKFPRPYTPLGARSIRRINSQQQNYDKDPEKAEKEQKAEERRRQLKEERLRQERRKKMRRSQ